MTDSDELVELNYDDVWSFNHNAPSAVGFLQINSCVNTGVEGVRCLPDSELFATGMNGDEDLKEDIIMKGEPYHYNQKRSRDDPAASGKPAGYESVASEPEKVHVLQTPNAGQRTTYYN